MIYKILHGKLKIEQHEPPLKTGNEVGGAQSDNRTLNHSTEIYGLFKAAKKMIQIFYFYIYWILLSWFIMKRISTKPATTSHVK